MFPIPRSCLSKTISKLVPDFSPDKGILRLIHIFPIKCSSVKLVVFVMVPAVCYFRGYS